MNRTPSRYRCNLAALTVLAAIFAPAAGFAAVPTIPGMLTGSAANQQVSLQWEDSQDDNEVAGYNVYINGAYLQTVFESRYTGSVDTSRENTFYVTAFDTPLPGEERAYSAQSDSIVLDMVDPKAPIPDEGGPIPVDGGDTTAPSVPVGLTLISADAEGIAFRWSASTDDVGILGYNVYRMGQYVNTVFSTEYLDGTPIPNVPNDYSVVAFDEARNFTPQSEVLSVTVPGDPTTIDPVDPDPSTPTQPPVNPDPGTPDEDDVEAPSTPAGLAVTSTVAESVGIKWNPSSDNVGVVGYNIYRNGSYYTTRAPGTSATFIDVRTSEGESFSYSVVAYDEARNFSQISAEVEVKVTDTQEPVDPTDPVDPVDPVDPTDPTDPTDPSVPDDDGEMVPVSDPTNRFPSPDPNDPFGSRLENDPEEPVVGGPPTTPKNLRFDLVSNDWAEISWAPSNDDEGVVAYRIYRDDGVVYTISPDQTDSNGGSQAEIDKYWSTTSFIDCNYTRFDTRVHNCRENRPVPGETYVYQVSALDEDGGESEYSKPLSITYHLPENSPVPIFDDFYKMPDDRFAQNNDLSETRFFLDEFDLVFNDEFEGTSIDETKWQTELTWKDSIIINGEQQYFVRTQDDPEFGYDPFSFDGEQLTISAIPTPDDLRDKLPEVCDVDDPTGNERCQFLSGALSSHDRFGFIYGFVEGRMKVGATPGMLSSFYLYHRYKGTGVNLHAPEIDIVEYLGDNPFGDEDAFQTYHFDDVNSGLTRSAPTMAYKNPDGERYSDDYHTFGVLWEPQLIVWYIDGKEVKRLTGPMVSRQPMNIVNYLVAGSSWAPTPDLSDPDIFPLEYDVDYIRVYQRDAYKATASFGP